MHQVGHATGSAPARIVSAIWYEQNTGLNRSRPEMNATRKTYRPEVYAEPILIPSKAGTRSHKITTVALLPEPLRETRDPTFAHNVAVRVP